jgi:hypothetical protein
MTLKLLVYLVLPSASLVAQEAAGSLEGQVVDKHRRGTLRSQSLGEGMRKPATLKRN